jgi:hypothetical protein
VRSHRVAMRGSWVTIRKATPELAVELPHHLEDLVGGLGVEVAGGLVGEHERRVERERAGDGHALLLPTRERVGARLRLLAEAHPREQRARARDHLLRGASRARSWASSRSRGRSAPAGGGETGTRSRCVRPRSRVRPASSRAWCPRPAMASAPGGPIEQAEDVEQRALARPDGPTSAANSPRSTRRSTPFSTSVTTRRRRRTCAPPPGAAPAQPLRIASAGSSRDALRAGSAAAKQTRDEHAIAAERESATLDDVMGKVGLPSALRTSRAKSDPSPAPKAVVPAPSRGAPPSPPESRNTQSTLRRPSPSRAGCRSPCPSAPPTPPARSRCPSPPRGSRRTGSSGWSCSASAAPPGAARWSASSCRRRAPCAPRCPRDLVGGEDVPHAQVDARHAAHEVEQRLRAARRDTTQRRLTSRLPRSKTPPTVYTRGRAHRRGEAHLVAHPHAEIVGELAPITQRGSGGLEAPATMRCAHGVDAAKRAGSTP